MNLLKSFYNFVQNIRFSKTFERDIQNFYVSYIVKDNIYMDCTKNIHGLYIEVSYLFKSTLARIKSIQVQIQRIITKKNGFKKGMLAVERQFSLKWKDMENIKYNPLQKTIR